MLTPRELVLHFDGATLRMKREQEARAWLAFNSGIIGRLKHPPRSHADLLPKEAARRKRPDEMIAAARAWHAAITRREHGVAGRNTPR